MWSQRLFQTHYSFLTGSSFQKHDFWVSRTKLALKMRGNVESSSLLKQHLFCWGNITAVVFPKQLKLSVINCAHSVLTSSGIRLACGSLLKPQKLCQGFTETLLRFQCLFGLSFWTSSGVTNVVLIGLLCFSLLLSSVNIFILKFFVAARL